MLVQKGRALVTAFLSLGLTLVCSSNAHAFGGRDQILVNANLVPDCQLHLCKLDPAETKGVDGESLSNEPLSHSSLANDNDCWKRLAVAFDECFLLDPELQVACYRESLERHIKQICVGMIRTNDAE